MCSERLRTRDVVAGFQLGEESGPEYQRTVARAGDRRAAESQLTERERRRRELKIVALEPASRSRYQEAWRATQGKFVDDPAAAAREADELVARVLCDPGLPGG
jgi:hypothetical protein